MNRTPASIERRRNLVNAAGGFPERSRVVLYANIDDDGNPDAVLNELQMFAEARNWDSAEEHRYYDTGPADPPDRERPGWSEVSRLLLEGLVDGVVTPSEVHIAATPGERAEFRAWLASIRRFMGCLHESGREPVETANGEGAEE